MELSEIGRQFGLDESQIRVAFAALAPIAAAGMRRYTRSDEPVGPA